MRKQHGHIFEAPLCDLHKEEMSLSRMSVNGRVDWQWYCPRDDIAETCQEPRDVSSGEVPDDIFKEWGDPVI